MANLLHLTGQALRNASGAPYTSAKASFFETGTTTPKNTYSDAGLTAANTNPVIADGTTGIFPDIYLLAGRYKVVLQQSDGTSIDTWDPYDATQQIITATAAPSPAYPFMVYHSSTDGHRYRRNAANNAWIDEGLVDSLGNTTTVTNQLAGTATNEFSTPDTVAALVYRGSDITAAATLSLPATGGGAFNLTGTATTINGISSASGGREIELRSNAAHTWTHNGTSFILPGAANFTSASGDVLRFRNEAATDATGSNWRCTKIMKATGSPINITDQIATQVNMEASSSLTTAVSPGRQHFHPGHPKAWLRWNGTGTPAITESYNCSSITDNAVGDNSVNFTTAFSSAGYGFTGTCGNDGAVSQAYVLGQYAAAPTTTAFRAGTVLTGTGASDMARDSMAFFGDQV